jgi:hypothetical protein
MPKLIVSEADKSSSARDVWHALVRLHKPQSNLLNEMGGYGALAPRPNFPQFQLCFPSQAPITGSFGNSTAHPPDLGLTVSSNTRSQYSAAIRSWWHIGMVHVLPIDVRPNFNLFQQDMERDKESLKLFKVLYLGGICPLLELPALLLKVLIHTQ